MTREFLKDVLFRDVVTFGTGTVVDYVTGSGSPEGVVTAVVGSLYMRNDGGSSTTMYVKESGSGNTGWKPVLAGAVPFARGGTLINPVAGNVYIWRAPFVCTVTAVKGIRNGGTGATVNARKNGASNHLSSALSLTSADTWMDGGSVQNTSYSVGDSLEIMFVSVTGSPAQVAIQVEFTKG